MGKMGVNKISQGSNLISKGQFSSNLNSKSKNGNSNKQSLNKTGLSSNLTQSTNKQGSLQQPQQGQSGSQKTPSGSSNLNTKNNKSSSLQQPQQQGQSGDTQQTSQQSTSNKQSSGQSGTGGGGGKGGSSGGKGSSDGGGGSIVSEEEISQALTGCSYDPNPQYLSPVAEGINQNFESKDLAAMFLAQIIHETGGLVHLEEIKCKENPDACANDYNDNTGVEGKSYHGRGFIQVSWAENYRKAGETLGLGDQLVQNPEQVAEDPDLAMQTSIWYWNSMVIEQTGDNPTFGQTTKAINGPIECGGGDSSASEKRYSCYQAVAKALGVEPTSNEGC